MTQAFAKSQRHKIVDYDADARKIRKDVLESIVELTNEGAKIISVTETIFPAYLHQEHNSAYVMVITIYYTKE